MRVLITGGSGLIGRALTDDLVRSGNEVIILSRQPQGIIGLPIGARAALWDGHTTEGWNSLADGADAIVNLAGENISAGRWTSERKHSILESRLNAGRAVVQAVKEVDHKPRVVIQASAVGNYGARGDEEITEEEPLGRDFLAQVTAAWEASTSSLDVLGVRRVIIRTGVVLSTKGGALTRMLLPFRFFVGGRLGNGQQWFPWIHIADEVSAIRFLMENENARGPLKHFRVASQFPTAHLFVQPTGPFSFFHNIDNLP